MNARPLTRVSSDPKDLDVITPRQLLLLKNTNSLSPGIFDKKITRSEDGTS